MDDSQLLRYSRHLLLEEWSEQAQQRLLSAHALVIGAGGLGSPALLYLAASGVGRITVVDHDQVDLTNLQRQIAHSMDRIGQSKAHSAARSMAALNTDVQIEALTQRADPAWLAQALPQVDVVLDCTDQFTSRQMVNQACVRAAKPLVLGAAVRFDAQVTVFDLRQAASPCYACVFEPHSQVTEVACATLGIFAPLTGMVGAMQAAEAIKLLTGIGTSLQGRLLMLNALHMRWQEVHIKRQLHCPICATRI